MGVWYCPWPYRYLNCKTNSCLFGFVGRATRRFTRSVELIKRIPATSRDRSLNEFRAILKWGSWCSAHKTAWRDWAKSSVDLDMCLYKFVWVSQRCHLLHAVLASWTCNWVRRTTHCVSISKVWTYRMRLCLNRRLLQKPNRPPLLSPPSLAPSTPPVQISIKDGERRVTEEKDK